MLEELQVVRHSFGVGIIVPDPMSLCHKGYVMVDFDNVGLRSCADGELETVGRLKVEFDAQKCKRCVFASSSGCHRYNNGLLGHFPSSEKRVPKRIYPYCQQEGA